MELNVGDYVRTKHYGICKINDIYNEEKIELDKENAFGIKGVCYSAENIIKSRPKIIDLIEVGDYANGSKVIKIEEYNDEKYIYVEEMEFCNACNEYENFYYKEDSIKSVVTKEMYSSVEYRVESH